MKHYNRYVYKTASTMSILLALAGMLNHGIFEIRQGYTATNGFFIEAISRTDRFWIHGTEGAVTLVPNFLITGVIVVLLALALIVFALTSLSGPGRAKLLLLFFVLLTLFGGGIGHLVVSLPTWAFATRIHGPLNLIRRIPEGMRHILGRVWWPSLLAASLSWLTVMELGIFGYFPGMSDPDAVLNVVFLFLFSTTGFVGIAFLSAMAKDLNIMRTKDSV